MVFPSLPVYSNWHQQQHNHQQLQQRNFTNHEQLSNTQLPPFPTNPNQGIGAATASGGTTRAVSIAEHARKNKIPPPGGPIKCPRCGALNTKFCYYNNYSLSQPRYYCKSCRRYWTQGGTLRSVPEGGGRRGNKKNKNSNSKSSSHQVSSSSNTRTNLGPNLEGNIGNLHHQQTNQLPFLGFQQNMSQFGMSNIGLNLQNGTSSSNLITEMGLIPLGHDQVRNNVLGHHQFPFMDSPVGLYSNFQSHESAFNGASSTSPIAAATTSRVSQFGPAKTEETTSQLLDLTRRIPADETQYWGSNSDWGNADLSGFK